MIERDPTIRFHEEGTLSAVTRWVSTHDEGVAEWLKNVRRAYQVDRAGVVEEQRVALLLLKDEDSSGPARIGLLDVGGATLEDVTAWSTWQDPTASSRASGLAEEETQGNGGKAYMFRMFTGPARIMGVRDGKRNAKGFEGASGSVERGTPGFVPNVAEGREVPISSPLSELEKAIAPYGLTLDVLPDSLTSVVASRQAFTLVEASSPTDVFRGRWNSDDLVARILWHDQSTLAIQQLDVFALHNGESLNPGSPLHLPPIDPYPDANLQGPFVYPIPDELRLPDDGASVSTTERGTREPGRVVLQTSRENMPNAWKRLKARWKVSYRTEHQMVGSKPVSDLVPAAPGSAYVYGTVELPALEPSYVDHGRRRPKDGPLVEAVDQFVAERIRDLAKLITEKRRTSQDDRALDEVQEENNKLDDFKNKFLPTSSGEGDGGAGEDGIGPPVPPRPTPPQEHGEPDAIEMIVPDGGLSVGLGVDIRLRQVLRAIVVDSDGRPAPVTVTWHSSDPSVAVVVDGILHTRRRGKCDVWATASLGRGQDLRSEDVAVDVWKVDHVLLTPRSLEIPLARRQQVTAEVTEEDGRRSVDVYLSWNHDADDPFVLRIGPTGMVTGNRLGRSMVSAGAGDAAGGGVWARIPVEATVVPNPDEPGQGGGFPRLLVTGRDVDPSTQEIRDGDPDSPALWQETVDFVNNVWWLNLQSPEAAYAFERRTEDPEVWRLFHAQVVMQMVIEVHMRDEFTESQDERPDYWVSHRAASDRHRVRIVQQMWDGLQRWVRSGSDLG
jgi:hypothetical protein